MKVKYNRVSTIQQTGNRFTADQEKYDLVLLDKVSGSVPFSEREMAKKLIKLVESNQINEVIVEEFSRLGRNTGDVIKTLEWLEEQKINVIVRNIGLQSRPNGKKNAIWKMISSIMSSLYEMELENIKERTTVGRMVYVQKGGKLGRPKGTPESQKEFLQKQKSQNIIKYLKRGMSYSEISMLLKVSPKSIKKVKDLAGINR